MAPKTTRPLCTTFVLPDDLVCSALIPDRQVGGNALPAAKRAVITRIAQYRLLADYSNIMGQSGCVLKSARPLHNIFT
jgi:hypothetical protein